MQKRNTPIFILLLLLGASTTLFSQRAEYTTNEGTILAYNLSYGFQMPGADLQERFGNNINVGSGLQLFLPSNWMIELEGQYLFGQKVKLDVLAPLRGPEGYIFADNGGISDVTLRERGLWVGASVGKLFSLLPQNPRSGIRTSIGMGLLQHKIRIQDEPQVAVSALSSEHKKGYDRLSNGLAIKEFIGYQHFSRDRRINFFVGLEFIQGFTKNRRDWNTDEMSREEGSRIDLLYGFRAGWILPFWLGEQGENIYY